MFVIENIVKKDGAGAGAAVPSKPNVTFVRSKDVLQRPIRDSRGVKMLGDYVLKAGASMFTIYMVPSKQKQNFVGEGDEDMVTIKQSYEGVFPGDTLAANELFQNLVGEDLEIIAGNCVDGFMRAYGTECSPMKLKPSYTSDSSGRMHTLVFAQEVGSQFVPGFYYGNLVLSAPTSTDATLDLTQANGIQYELESAAVTAAIDVASIDLEHNTLVTLIGGGGVDPLTLAKGAGTAATVILKDGTNWTALEDATISLRVFDEGATIYLVEESRN